MNITDAISILEYLFLGGGDPPCLEALDVDAGGDVNISDAVALLGYLFRGSAPPPRPFPGCGEAVVASLGCESSACETDLEYRVRIRNEPELVSISIQPPRREDVDLQTKYLVPASDDPELLPPIFQNVRLHDLHYTFLTSTFPERFAGLSFDDYLTLVTRRVGRLYFAGELQRYTTTDGEAIYAFTVFVDESRPEESLSAEEIASIRDRLLAVFAPSPLAYAPGTRLQEQIARGWDDPPFPVYFPTPVSPPLYESYTEGVTFGRVRWMEKDELFVLDETGQISWQDIVVVDEAPSDMQSVAAGVVTGSRQSELSHLAIRLASRGTPNAFMDQPLSELHEWRDRLVRLEVLSDRLDVSEATEEEAALWWEESRPGPIAIPEVDEEFSELVAMTAPRFDSGDDPEARFGAKATNLARLTRVLPAENVVDGFAIPFHHYLRFLRENLHWDTDRIPPRLVTFEEKILSTIEDPGFRSDSERRVRDLAGLRDMIRKEGRVDPDLVTAVRDRVLEVFGSDHVKVRFRSSSNIEDALLFPGAGLYDSTSVCVADSFDGDDDDPSHCDATQDERTIERGVRKVWAGLWNFRAYEEREFHRVDHREAAMAVLVSRAFSDELANGVAFTGDPSQPAEGAEPGYLINAQLGEAPVVSPDPGALSEKSWVALDAGGDVQEVRRLRRSTLVSPGEWVLDASSLESLAALLRVVETSFPVDPQGHPVASILLDLEFKLTSTDRFVFKQIRPFLRPSSGEAEEPPP